MEYKLCKKIFQKGEMKNECVAEIPGKTVASINAKMTDGLMSLAPLGSIFGFYSTPPDRTCPGHRDLDPQLRVRWMLGGSGDSGIRSQILLQGLMQIPDVVRLEQKAVHTNGSTMILTLA